MSTTAMLTSQTDSYEIVRICCHCRRVRTTSGNWVALSSGMTGQLSHGICRECFLVHYPEFPPPDDLR